MKYREWAPCALAISLFGDFNNWNRDEFQASKDEFGVFTLEIPALVDGSPMITHGQKYKI